MSTQQYLSRGIDYIGSISSILRDLQGYRTLANELIQNADDAKNTTSMTFDVRDDALVVDNDGIFSECQEIDQPVCTWQDDKQNEGRCDFHRFRRVASGDKRSEADTTGAFGIGFIAVYQITDRPELISSAQHWVLSEEQHEDERIAVCPGCPKCTETELPGTRFILPWAWNGESRLRQALRAEPVSADGPAQMVEELKDSLPVAMLFLKHLRIVVIRRNGHIVRKLERLDEDDTLLLSDGTRENDRTWYIIRGQFSQEATQLREKHPGRIEDKRSAEVTVAISSSEPDAGCLCACLPTEQDLGLPFHINADFFPTSNRKQVILSEDYQSDWNRAALRAAARALGQGIRRLPDWLGAKRFWSLAATLKEVADRAEKREGESVLEEYWKQVEPQLQTAPVVYTTSKAWAMSANTCLLLQKDEARAISVLEALGVQVAHEDLRPYQSLLRSRSVGVAILDIQRICNALQSCGLEQRTELTKLPPALDTTSKRQTLWDEIAHLLERKPKSLEAKEEDERRLKRIAVAPGRDSALWPCGQIYSADEPTVHLFEPLGLGISFVADEPAFRPLANLCLAFDARAAITVLGRRKPRELELAWKQGQLPLQSLFQWFVDRGREICNDPELKAELAALSLFPSLNKLHTLKELDLPGNFRDPLGLAELADLDALGGHSEFLRDLGMRELDFRTYASERLPNALASKTVIPKQRRAAIMLLADRVGELKDNEEARRKLASKPLVETIDGEFRQARECYFDTTPVRECLGDSAHLAMLPEAHRAAVRDLYAWLGVTKEPRLNDVSNRVQLLASAPYSPGTAEQVQLIFAHLGGRIRGEDHPIELRSLKTTKWLPAYGKSDRWYAPNELYAVYQDYLFKSQALFLDAPRQVQAKSNYLLEFLGVHLKPRVSLVVQHLLHCASHGIPVHTEVYRFLNDTASDPVITHLKETRCLWFDEAYHAPSQVFWAEHPFGQYRWRLREEHHSHANLLKTLDVRDVPDHRDALGVLREISSKFGLGNIPLDKEAYDVLMACWQMLERALEEEAISIDDLKPLGAEKCVPNAKCILHRPDWMFFENRAGLAAKFGKFLAGNVIPRPLGAGTAFSAAGVRQLGSAVAVELLDCADPADDPKMADKIRARRNEIGRVLSSQGPSLDVDEALVRLRSIRYEASTLLRIRYCVRLFEQERHSQPESVPALYQPERETLSFTVRNGHTHWAALARELAIALFPDLDPGRFACGLKEVLTADSPEEATATLDELGLPRLDTTPLDAPAPREATSALGRDEPGEGDTSEGEGTLRKPEVITRDDAIHRITDQDTRPSTPGGRRTPGLRKRTRRPILRSYLPAPKGAVEDSTENNGSDWEKRSLVDEAGVRRVLEYESAAGRRPKEMPHTNPGYDVESRDGSGQVVRYIEVKSLSGKWSKTYAVLSRSQFDKATELGDKFWLYVVECAESGECQLHTIQNPALRANHFMFDDGWRATSTL